MVCGLMATRSVHSFTVEMSQNRFYYSFNIYFLSISWHCLLNSDWNNYFPTDTEGKESREGWWEKGSKSFQQDKDCIILWYSKDYTFKMDSYVIIIYILSLL